MAADNGFTDLWDAFRKYILPKSAGGGYTAEEEAKIKKDLETAYNNSKNKTGTDYAKDAATILGLDVGKAENQMLIVGLIVLAFIVLKD